MTTTDAEIVPLGELEPYDQALAITLREARALIRGHGQGGVNYDVLRRWADPERGCRVGSRAGQGGVRIVLPSKKVGGRLWTMRCWVEAFRRTRERLGERRPAPAPERPRRTARAAQKRAARKLDRAGIGIHEPEEGGN